MFRAITYITVWLDGYSVIYQSRLGMFFLLLTAADSRPGKHPLWKFGLELITHCHAVTIKKLFFSVFSFKGQKVLSNANAVVHLIYIILGTVFFYQKKTSCARNFMLM